MRVSDRPILFPDWMSTRSHAGFKRHSSIALRPSAPKQITVAVARHPLRPGQMTVESMASAVRIESGIDLKNDTRDLAPVGVICFGIEETSISDGMLLIIVRHRRVCGRYVCNFGIERRHYRKLLRA